MERVHPGWGLDNIEIMNYVFICMYLLAFDDNNELRVRTETFHLAVTAVSGWEDDPAPASRPSLLDEENYDDDDDALHCYTKDVGCKRGHDGRVRWQAYQPYHFRSWSALRMGLVLSYYLLRALLKGSSDVFFQGCLTASTLLCNGSYLARHVYITLSFRSDYGLE